MLADELSRELDKWGNRDILHLNVIGTRVLAGLIKQSVLFRFNGGVDKRKHAKKVNGVSYANMARELPAQWSRRPAD